MAQQYRFDTYTAEDGISQLVTHALHQDRDGYIWIGTEAGLNRYDGHAFKVFGIAEGMASDAIIDIKQDWSGTLWVATREGLSRIENDRIRNYGLAEGVPGERIVSVLIDNQGRVWCGGDTGLARLLGERFVKIGEDQGLPSARVNVLTQTRNGRIWIGSDAGLFYIDDEGQVKPTTMQSGADPAIFALAEDRQGRLWVGQRDGIFAYQGSEQVLQFTVANGLPPIRDRYLRLLVDRFDVVWVSTEDGLAMIDQDVLQTISTVNGLPFTEIRALMEDRDGMIWFGGFGGTAKFVGRAFANYTQAEGLGASNVRPILRDRNGMLWVGTLSGLSRFDGERWGNFSATHGMSNNIVRGLVEDTKDRLWISSSGGLDYFDGTTIKLAPFLDDNPTLRSERLEIVEDYSGRIWMTNVEVGLYSWDGEQVVQHEVPGQPSGFVRLFVDSQGWIWASGANGLSRWDGNNWKTYTTDDGLAHNRPYHITEDRQGNLWFGYRASFGITRYDGQTFVTYTTADGLTNDAVYSIGVDHDNNIWIGTARGVDRFDGRTFVNYSPGDGYASFESNAGGFMADADGTLWFGTAEGLSHYNPRYDYLLDLPVRAPQIDSFTMGSLSGHPGLIANYSENDLLAFISPLSYVNQQHAEYRYRLIGYDDQWAELRGFEINYTNLPAGEFRLEVQGRRSNGSWSQPATASFTILPPLWQTWWFITATIVLLLLTIYGFYRWRMRQIAARNAELEHQVTARTDELKRSKTQLEARKNELEQTLDELQATKYELVRSAHKAGMVDIATSVLHNIGNVMNSVNTSAQCIRDTLHDSSVNRLTKANAIIRENQDNIDHLIQDRDRVELLLQYYLKVEEALIIEQESMTSHSARVDEKVDLINEIIIAQNKIAEYSDVQSEQLTLNDVVDSALTLQAKTLERHGIRVELDIRSGPMVLAQKAKLIDVLLNLIQNAQEAMVDSQPDNKVLRVSLYDDGSNAYLDISDRGCGIATANLNQVFSQGYTSKKDGHGFGLHSAAIYMNEMGGTIRVHSEGPNRGCTFTLELPLVSAKHQSLQEVATPA